MTLKIYETTHIIDTARCHLFYQTYQKSDANVRNILHFYN